MSNLNSAETTERSSLRHDQGAARHSQNFWLGNYLIFNCTVELLSLGIIAAIHANPKGAPFKAAMCQAGSGLSETK